MKDKKSGAMSVHDAAYTQVKANGCQAGQEDLSYYIGMYRISDETDQSKEKAQTEVQTRYEGQGYKDDLRAEEPAIDRADKK